MFKLYIYSIGERYIYIYIYIYIERERERERERELKKNRVSESFYNFLVKSGVISHLIIYLFLY
jgi:hypothetical protein